MQRWFTVVCAFIFYDNLKRRRAHSKGNGCCDFFLNIIVCSDAWNHRRKLVLYFTHLQDELSVSRSFFCALYLFGSSSLFFVCFILFLELLVALHLAKKFPVMEPDTSL
jgi:hypothetical protein